MNHPYPVIHIMHIQSVNVKICLHVQSNIILQTFKLLLSLHEAVK